MSEMSGTMYGCFRLDKLHDGAEIKGQCSHVMRYHASRTNQDIDPARSSTNTVLMTAAHLERRVHERIRQLRLKRKRKDAVVCLDAVVGASSNFFNSMTVEEQDEFFCRALGWVVKRFGSDNVMYAIVHRDESGAPHMHVGIVPVTADLRLSARDIMSRKNLEAYQSEYYEQVGKGYGLARGVSAKERREQGETPKHVSTAEYKEYKKVLELLKAHEAREGEVDQIAARASKKLLGDGYTIGGKDLRRLMRLARDGAVAEHQVRELTRQVDNLTASVAARDASLKYEKDVNETLRDKVHQAAAYLAADASDRQQVDAFLAARQREKRKYKYQEELQKKQQKKLRQQISR